MSFIPIPEGAEGIFVETGNGLSQTGAGTEDDPLVFTISANVKGFVNHGATAGTARPAGFTSVEWYGSVEPTNAVNGDTWTDTSA